MEGDGMEELFTRDEVEEIRDRAFALAGEYESDASLRAALQLLGEAADNLVPKVAPRE